MLCGLISITCVPVNKLVGYKVENAYTAALFAFLTGSHISVLKSNFPKS